jgi:ElaB/YqjD/DUF883 family membrane-anchored ribosome-binding protein
MGFRIVLAAVAGVALVAIWPRPTFFADEAVFLRASGRLAALDADLGFGFGHVGSLVHGQSSISRDPRPRRSHDNTGLNRRACPALNSRVNIRAVEGRKPAQSAPLGKKGLADAKTNNQLNPGPAASSQGHEIRFANQPSEDLRVNNTTKARPEVETPANFDAIVDDLAALRRDFAALMSQMKSGAFQGANGAAENTLGQLGDRANHLYDSVAAQGERSAKAIARHVEEQPVMSLLLAFGVGFIASRLLVR